MSWKPAAMLKNYQLQEWMKFAFELAGPSYAQILHGFTRFSFGNSLRLLSASVDIKKYKKEWHLAIGLAWGHTVENNKRDQCNISISLTANLNNHMKVHSGGKSNKCDQCNFSKSKTANLKKHMKVNSGKKFNKCDQSKFSTTQAANLRIHIYTVVKIRKKCDLYLLNSVGTLSCQSQDTQQFALLRQKCFGINRYWSRDNIVYQRGKRTNARMYRVGNMCAKCALLSQRLNLKWIQVEFICSMCIYTEMDWNMWRGFDSRYMFYVIQVWQLHSGAEKEKVGICLSHDNLSIYGWNLEDSNS